MGANRIHATSQLAGFVLIATTIVAMAAPLAAQHVGDRVVVRDGADIRVGTEVVDRATRGDVFTVKAVNDNWLWVSHHASGWIPKSAVVDFDAAIANFTAYLQQYPSAELYETRGLLYFHEGNFAAAANDFSSALRLAPQEADLFSRRAMALQEKGEREKAIADYDAAIKLSPNDAMIYHNRAALWHAEKAWDKAAEDLSKALELNPIFDLALEHRGLTYSAAGKHDLAIADFTKGIELHPKQASLYKLRGDEYKRLKKYPEAVADFEKAILLDPQDAPSRNALAWLLATCPDDKVRAGAKAVIQAQTACKLTMQRSAICLDTLAAAQAEAGQFADATASQTKAIAVADASFDKAGAETRLKLYQASKPVREE